MSFASAERAFYEMSGEIDCACDRGGDDCTCEQDAEDAAEQDAIDRADSERKGEW